MALCTINKIHEQDKKIHELDTSYGYCSQKEGAN